MAAVSRARSRIGRHSPLDAFCRLCLGEGAEHVYTKSGFDLVRCTSCGLVYVRNPPTQEEIEQLYTFASGYHTAFRSFSSPESRTHAARAEQFLRIVRRHSRPGRILDVGCSVGFFLELARAEGWTALGVEMSNDTAQLARERGLDVLTGTLEQASLPSQSFDVVTMWDLLEHVKDPVGTVAIAAEVLKENGLLTLSTPNVAGLFPRLSYRVARWTGHWPHPEPPAHLFQFSKKTIKRLLRQNGLLPIEILDRRIPLAYTFGPRSTLLRNPKRLAYAAVFAPLAFVAPFVGAGDDMLVVARKMTA